MNKHKSTSPSMYYERQTNAHAPVVLQVTGIRDGEAFMAILGAGVFGLALGMLIAAGMAGLL